MSRYQFTEDLEAALPFTSEVAENFAFLQITSSDCFIDNLLVISDNSVTVSCSIIERCFNNFDAADFSQAFLMFYLIALVSFAKDKQLSFIKYTSDLSNGQDVEIFELVVDHTTGA